MTEENWSNESSDRPVPKKGLPKWLYFLGCGCLGIVLMVGAGGYFAVRTFNTMKDPAVQWPALAEVLPVDEPYPEMDILGIPMMSMAPGIDGGWTLISDNGRITTVVYALSGDSAREVRDGLLSNQGEVDLGFAGGVHNLKIGTIVIQGRELDAARFTSHEGNAEESEDEESGEGFMSEMKQAIKKAAIRIDVTPEGVEGSYVLVEIAKVGTLEALTDAEINDLLAPFHIGPDR